VASAATGLSGHSFLPENPFLFAMITVEQATAIVLQHALSLGTKTLPLAQARGRVLREPLIADRDFPPFNRVAMDGIAIDSKAFFSGRRDFTVAGIQAAGKPQETLEQVASHCLEVMTGAMLPLGTDAVVRYEDLDISEGVASLRIPELSPWQHVHRQGTDQRQGSTLLPAGTILTPAEIGLAATVGKAELQVAALPKVALVSTGDELVEVGDLPLPHQIRKSNVHTLAAQLESWGLTATLLHLPDEKAKIVACLDACLEQYEVLLLSGGVSMGKFDYLPAAFEALGVKRLFHKVSQRPGKPFWFGQGRKTVVFAFPGNPVSTFMCTHRYFQPWLRTSLGLPAFEARYAMLSEAVVFKPELTHFLQVKIDHQPDGRVLACPVAGHGSGDLANLAAADAFLELPAHRDFFEKGESFPLFVYRF
jgi:molybdopterin molybdotransferase